MLNAIQDAIAAQEDVIAAARQFKRSLMQRLFTVGPYREPAETKETEIGEIPAHWEVVELGDLLSDPVRNGVYKPRSAYGHGTTKIVQLNDIYLDNGLIDVSQLDTAMASNPETQRYAVHDKDIIINRVSKREEGVGAVAIVTHTDTDDVVFESNMFRVRLDQERILPRFFLHYGNTTIYHDQVLAGCRRDSID